MKRLLLLLNRFDGARDHVAKHLQQGGYHTGMIGKWHLGSDPTGFDRWLVLPGQGSYWNPVFLAPGRKLTIQGHCTDITTELGLEFIRTRPKDKSFMQGRSLAPLLRGEAPKDWRTSIYYRYYHSPGHHNTAAHLGVRTATHKLIHYWKQDAWELFDLTQDPTEQRNLLHSAADATKPEVAARFSELKAEIIRLQKEYRDDGLYADPATWPKGEVDGPFDDKPPSGRKTVPEAIALSATPRL